MRMEKVNGLIMMHMMLEATYNAAKKKFAEVLEELSPEERAFVEDAITHGHGPYTGFVEVKPGESATMTISKSSVDDKKEV